MVALLGLAKPLKPPRGLGKATPRATQIEKLPRRPTGSRALSLGQYADRVTGGPGEPPEGFVGVWTSLTEWYVYWALFKITDPSADPRQPPFVGNEHFIYQKQEEGGRVPGGSVTDFALSTPTGWIGLRVETERFHIWTTAEVQMKDFGIKTHLDSMERVISIWDQHFIGDESGQEVIRVCKLAMKGVELPSPIKWGTAERVR
jgi:hypothetical protein